VALESVRGQRRAERHSLKATLSTMEQVVENPSGRALRAGVESAGRSGVGTMGSEELALVDRVREQYQALAAGAIP
jgi:hypothetical protein